MNSHAYFTRRLLQLPVVFMEATGLSTETVQLCCPSCSETVKKCNTNHFTSTIKIVPFKTWLQHWGTTSTMNAKHLLFWRNFCVAFFPGIQYVQFLIMPPLFPHLCLSMCNFRVPVTVCLSSCLHRLCTFPLTSNNCFCRFIILTPATCFWVLSLSKCVKICA